MRFAIILGSLLSAASYVVADGAAVVSAIETIAADAVKLNSSVASFEGLTTILEALTINSDSSALLKAIKAGTSTAQASSNFTLGEALALVAPTQDLVTKTESTLQTIQNKKSAFASVLLQPIILKNLKDQKTASDAFSAAVIAKVPDFAQEYAASLTAPLDPAFETAIEDYETYEISLKPKAKRAVEYRA